MKVQCNMQNLLDYKNYSQAVTDLLTYVKYVANIYALTTCYWKGTSHSTSIDLRFGYLWNHDFLNSDIFQANLNANKLNVIM